MIYQVGSQSSNFTFELGIAYERGRVTALLVQEIIALEEEVARAESPARRDATMDRLDAWQDAFALVTATKVGGQGYELALRKAKMQAIPRAPE